MTEPSERQRVKLRHDVPSSVAEASVGWVHTGERSERINGTVTSVGSELSVSEVAA
ncbi:hypothetical protein ABZ942_17320 [Nocardia sp. NPDC046473]|uniref:hypothetical protein n=1 Tax=Nocardia sp. NPDC046473 TaxID=3155733 RepID=UPI0033F164FF